MNLTSETALSNNSPLTNLSSNVVVGEGSYTYEDYLNTPEDVRYELIEGELIMTPSPSVTHQRISRKIEFALEKFVTEYDLGEVFNAPCDIYLDDKTIFQPDIMFISKDRSDIINDKNIAGAPDLAIEILSNSSAYRDMVTKKRIYAKFGVLEYWIVDPIEGGIEIFVREGNDLKNYKNYTKDDILKSPLLKGLEIDLKKIFI